MQNKRVFFVKVQNLGVKQATSIQLVIMYKQDVQYDDVGIYNMWQNIALYFFYIHEIFQCLYNVSIRYKIFVI